MPTTPYARLRVSLNGGTATPGASDALNSDTVQLSAESYIGWGSNTQNAVARWEILDFPEDFPLPTDWSFDGGSGAYYYLGNTAPPVFDIPASTDVWGKWMFRLTVDGGLRAGVASVDMIDVTCCLRVFSPLGFQGVGATETTQFYPTKGWAGSVNSDLDAVGSVTGVIESLGTTNVLYATAASLAAYTRVANVITANANGALSVDGASPGPADRILVKNGVDPEDNGIYSVTQVGDGGAPFILTRSDDQNTSAKVVAGLRVYCVAGTVNFGTIFVLNSVPPTVLNTTELRFVATFATDSGTAVDLAPLATIVKVGERGVGADLQVDQVTTGKVASPAAVAGTIFAPGGTDALKVAIVSTFPVIVADAAMPGIRIEATTAGQIAVVNAEQQISLIVEDATTGKALIGAKVVEVYGAAGAGNAALLVTPNAAGTTKVEFGAAVTRSEISQPSTTAATGAAMAVVAQESTHAAGVGALMLLLSGEGTVTGGEWIAGSQVGSTFAGKVRLKIGVTSPTDGSGGATVLLSDQETFNTKLFNPNEGTSFEAHDDFAAIAAPLVTLSVDSVSPTIAANGWDYPKKSTTSAVAETKLVLGMAIPNGRNGIARVTCTAYSATSAEQYTWTGAYHVVQNGGTAVVTAFSVTEIPATDFSAVDAILAANSWTIAAAGGSLNISYVNNDATNVIITLTAYVKFTMDGH